MTHYDGDDTGGRDRGPLTPRPVTNTSDVVTNARDIAAEQAKKPIAERSEGAPLGHRWMIFSIKPREEGGGYQTHGVLWSNCSAEDACQRVAEEAGRSTWCFALDLGGGGAFYSLFVPGKDFSDFGNCGYVPIEQVAAARRDAFTEALLLAPHEVTCTCPEGGEFEWHRHADDCPRRQVGAMLAGMLDR